MSHLADWLQSAAPDVVCLQETKMEDHKFPLQALEDLGYEAAFTGQKSYNGVAILSRCGLSDVCTDFGAVLNAADQRRVIAATIRGVRVINVYVVNGQSLDSEKFQFKMRWLAALTSLIAAELSKHRELVLLGDFNIAPGDLDVYDPIAWGGQIHCSVPEREALAKLYTLGLHDSYRTMLPNTQAFSWWDYRQAAYARNMGLRIDLALISDALKARLLAVGIDKNPREQANPSDHTPVWLSLAPGSAP